METETVQELHCQKGHMKLQNHSKVNFADAIYYHSSIKYGIVKQTCMTLFSYSKCIIKRSIVSLTLLMSNLCSFSIWN